jgi:anti-sigma factor RsiW
MKNHWHEDIQQYLNGQATVEEAAALQAALGEDADLRALYLDYMNLDVALAAAAEAATITDDEIGWITPLPRSPTKTSPHYWRWLAAAATACAVLVMFAMLPRHRKPPQTRPDVAAACDSAQEAIARLSVEPPSSFPAWASPTAAILDQPQIAKWDP